MKIYATVLSCVVLAGVAVMPALAEHSHGNEEFLQFLAEIDDGNGPQPDAIAEPPTRSLQDAHILAWQGLDITHELQRKDTKMLCLDGCSETGSTCWDGEQVDHNGHGSHYCVRASVKMINSYYGGVLSQDRMTYWMIVEYPASNKKALKTDFDLWHGSGSGNEMLPWALGYAYNDWSKITSGSGKPSYSSIKTWIGQGRPIRVSIPGHSMVIDGWWEDGAILKVHLLDPWCLWDGNDSHSGAGWRDYYGSYLNITGYDVCPTPAQVPSPRVQESYVTLDSDGDGICDFDEIYRFGTNRFSVDTDGDGIRDKAEIRSYIFDNNGNHNVLQRIGNIWSCKVNVPAGPCGYIYNPAATGVPWASLAAGWTCPRCGNSKSGFRNEITECMPASPYDPNPDVLALIHANADPDGDGLRIERDPDSDNDGALDGQEDTNHNGKYEPDLGETNPFDPNERPLDGTLSSADDLLVTDDLLVAGDLIVKGNLYCSGNKAVISTENHGRRLVFVEESASSWHFDRGRSQLHGGTVTIHLDPIFLQTVTIGEAAPPVIRLTATADCSGLYVAKWTATSFTVKELDGGASDSTFNWEFAATRHGYEKERLQELTIEED